MTVFRNVLWFYLLLIICVVACGEDELQDEHINEQGVVIDKNYLWKVRSSDKYLTFAGGINFGIWGDKYISASQFGELPALSAFNVESGDIEWTWDDFIAEDVGSEYIGIIWPYVYENYLVFHIGSRAYCIDAETGQTVWSRDFNYGTVHSYINGFENHYYFSAQNTTYDSLDRVVITSFKTNVLTGQEQEMPYAPFDYLHHDWERRANWFTGGRAFRRNGKEYFVSTYQRITGHYDITSSLNLYNSSDDEWIYAQKVLRPAHTRNTSDGFPEIENNIVVNVVGHAICANDLWTGDSLWLNERGGNYAFGGFFIHQGYVYAMAENDALYCYDLQTGDECWRMGDAGLGTTSHMVHLNGIIYFTSGGNGNLMAVDMENGELLWNINSPDRESFNREVAVLPGENGRKGRVVTATYQSVLSYEAIR